MGRSTIEVVQSLHPEDLDDVVDPQHLVSEGALRDEALGIASEREGWSKGLWLGHMDIGHNQLRRGEALTIRSLLGIRNC